jgi:hypothetical protein
MNIGKGDDGRGKERKEIRLGGNGREQKKKKSIV